MAFNSGIVLSSFGAGMLLLHGYGVAPEQEFYDLWRAWHLLWDWLRIAALRAIFSPVRLGLLERGPTNADSMADRRLFFGCSMDEIFPIAGLIRWPRGSDRDE